MSKRPYKKRHKFIYVGDPDSRTCRDCGLCRRHPITDNRTEWGEWEYETQVGWHRETVVPTCPPSHTERQQ